MAKSKRSGSSTIDDSFSESSNVVQFFMEGMDTLRCGEGTEPVNHIPYVDIYSNKDELIIEVEIPGVRMEDIDLSVFKGALNIKAIKYDCFEEENVNYICMERSFGRLFRSIEIPITVNTSKISAKYNDGILRIVIPRVSDKRGQPIKIKVEGR